MGDKIFFVHVMKTAGTSFGTAYRSQFAPGELYPQIPDVDPAERYTDIAALLGLPAERHRSLRAYMGHFPFYVTELLPHPVDRITVLREPVARTISWLRRRLDHGTGGTSLEAIYDDVLMRRRLVVNHQTKVLSMEATDQPNTYLKVIDVDRARLDKAKARLEQVAVLGVSEHLDRFVRSVNDRYGWSIELRKRRNASTEHPVPDRLLERIRTDVALDTELYQHALDLLGHPPT